MIFFYYSESQYPKIFNFFFSVAQIQLIFFIKYKLLWPYAPVCPISMAKFHLRQSQPCSKNCILKHLSTFSDSIVHLKKIHYWKCGPLSVYLTFWYWVRVCDSVLDNRIKDVLWSVYCCLFNMSHSYIMYIFHTKFLQ